MGKSHKKKDGKKKKKDSTPSKKSSGGKEDRHQETQDTEHGPSGSGAQQVSPSDSAQTGSQPEMPDPSGGGAQQVLPTDSASAQTGKKGKKGLPTPERPQPEMLDPSGGGAQQVLPTDSASAQTGKKGKKGLPTPERPQPEMLGPSGSGAQQVSPTDSAQTGPRPEMPDPSGGGAKQVLPTDGASAQTGKKGKKGVPTPERPQPEMLDPSGGGAKQVLPTDGASAQTEEKGKKGVPSPERPQPEMLGPSGSGTQQVSSTDSGKRGKKGKKGVPTPESPQPEMLGPSGGGAQQDSLSDSASAQTGKKEKKGLPTPERPQPEMLGPSGGGAQQVSPTDSASAQTGKKGKKGLPTPERPQPEMLGASGPLKTSPEGSETSKSKGRSKKESRPPPGFSQTPGASGPLKTSPEGSETSKSKGRSKKESRPPPGFTQMPGTSGPPETSSAEGGGTQSRPAFEPIKLSTRQRLLLVKHMEWVPITGPPQESSTDAGERRKRKRKSGKSPSQQELPQPEMPGTSGPLEASAEGSEMTAIGPLEASAEGSKMSIGTSIRKLKEGSYEAVLRVQKDSKDFNLAVKVTVSNAASKASLTVSKAEEPSPGSSQAQSSEMEGARATVPHPDVQAVPTEVEEHPAIESQPGVQTKPTEVGGATLPQPDEQAQLTDMEELPTTVPQINVQAEPTEFEEDLTQEPQSDVQALPTEVEKGPAIEPQSDAQAEPTEVEDAKATLPQPDEQARSTEVEEPPATVKLDVQVQPIEVKEAKEVPATVSQPDVQAQFTELEKAPSPLPQPDVPDLPQSTDLEEATLLQHQPTEGEGTLATGPPADVLAQPTDVEEAPVKLPHLYVQAQPTEVEDTPASIKQPDVQAQPAEEEEVSTVSQPDEQAKPTEVEGASTTIPQPDVQDQPTELEKAPSPPPQPDVQAQPTEVEEASTTIPQPDVQDQPTELEIAPSQPPQPDVQAQPTELEVASILVPQPVQDRPREGEEASATVPQTDVLAQPTDVEEAPATVPQTDIQTQRTEVEDTSATLKQPDVLAQPAEVEEILVTGSQSAVQAQPAEVEKAPSPPPQPDEQAKPTEVEGASIIVPQSVLARPREGDEASATVPQTDVLAQRTGVEEAPATVPQTDIQTQTTEVEDTSATLKQPDVMAQPAEVEEILVTVSQADIQAQPVEDEEILVSVSQAVQAKPTEVGEAKATVPQSDIQAEPTEVEEGSATLPQPDEQGRLTEVEEPLPTVLQFSVQVQPTDGEVPTTSESQPHLDTWVDEIRATVPQDLHMEPREMDEATTTEPQSRAHTTPAEVDDDLIPVSEPVKLYVHPPLTGKDVSLKSSTSKEIDTPQPSTSKANDNPQPSTSKENGTSQQSSARETVKSKSHPDIVKRRDYKARRYFGDWRDNLQPLPVEQGPLEVIVNHLRITPSSEPDIQNQGLVYIYKCYFTPQHVSVSLLRIIGDALAEDLGQGLLYPVYDGAGTLYSPAPLPIPQFDQLENMILQHNENPGQDFKPPQASYSLSALKEPVILIDPNKSITITQKIRVIIEPYVETREDGRVTWKTVDLRNLLSIMDESQMDCVTSLIEIVLRYKMWSSSSDYVPFGKAAYYTLSEAYLDDNPQVGMTNGLECWRGIYQCVFHSRASVFANIHMTHKSFTDKGITVLNIMVDVKEKLILTYPERYPNYMLPPHKQSKFRYSHQQLIHDGISQDELDEMNKAVSGLKVKLEISDPSVRMPYQHRSSRIHKIVRILPTTSDNCRMPTKRFGVLTVTQYFKKKYNYELNYPYLPVVRVDYGKRRRFIPCELCEILDCQLYDKPLDKIQKTKLNILSTQNALSTYGILKQNVNEIFTDNPWISQFGFTLSPDFCRVDAEVMAPITILSGGEIEQEGSSESGSDKGQEHAKKAVIKATEVQVWKGRWEPQRFLLPQNLSNWVILTIQSCTRDQILRRFIEELITEGEKLGMRINEPEIADIKYSFQSPYDHIKKTFEDTFKELEKKKIQLILVVFPKYARKHYRLVKYTAEITTGGLLTQCVMHETIFATKVSKLHHLLMKINTKLNGTNHIVDLTSLEQAITVKHTSKLEEGMMQVGAVIIYPGLNSRNIPSVAAVAASHDQYGMRYSMRWRVQDPCHQHIPDLTTLMQELLLLYRVKNNTNPRRIVYYRDGVSEGYVNEVYNREIQDIRNACTSFAKEYKPKITYLVVQRNHHVRFFSKGGCQFDFWAQNVPAGTTVTGDIVPSSERPGPIDPRSFYQVSHHCWPVGTARPTFYYFLLDENEFGDQGIQQLAYYSCHQSCRCTSIISRPAPNLYAHLAATRIRLYMLGGSNEEFNYIVSEETTLHNDMLRYPPMFFV